VFISILPPPELASSGRVTDPTTPGGGFLLSDHLLETIIEPAVEERVGAGSSSAAPALGSRPPRVVIVIHEELLGGATLSVIRCAPALTSRGWSISFWVPRPSEVFDFLTAQGQEVAGAPRPLAYSRAALRVQPGPRARLQATPGYLRRFVSHLRRAGAGLVHANSRTTIAELAVARALGRRTVFHVHEMAPRGRKGAVAARIARRLAHEVVAASEATARSWAIDSWSPRVVYEGVEIPSTLAPLPGRSPLVVGTIGRISRRKGVDLFVDAAAIVAERGLDVAFEIIGAPTDPLDARWARGVLARARALGIRHRLEADVCAALRVWDVFVLPSRTDPFPISMLEAMASGRPVIGTRVDGIAEQVTPDVGLLTEPDDPVALADAIATLAALPPDARAELGAAARRRAEEFSIEHQAEGLDAAYRAAVLR
jgi:glycosyltransferase involved in cell wall biosynthesis